MNTIYKTGPQMRIADGLAGPTRTPLSGYLDRYISSEIECMVREIGGWRRCRSVNDQNRRMMDWIEKNAAQFRLRWDRVHEERPKN